MSNVLEDLIRVTGELRATLQRNGLEPNCDIVFHKPDELIALSGMLMRTMGSSLYEDREQYKGLIAGEFKLNGFRFMHRHPKTLAGGIEIDGTLFRRVE